MMIRLHARLHKFSSIQFQHLLQSIHTNIAFMEAEYDNLAGNYVWSFSNRVLAKTYNGAKIWHLGEI